MKPDFLEKCQQLLGAYHEGKLGLTTMPEDNNPAEFKSTEIRLAYFTLPMALNYQRDSYKLWEAALKTYNDPETKDVFEVEKVATMSPRALAEKLLKHKLALQPNKHPDTWKRICLTVVENWGSISVLLESAKNDFLVLRQIIQQDHKIGFPYLSGPKIFNYWSFILQEYGKVRLRNSDQISIAPDTHIIQASVKLGLLSDDEAKNLSREEIAERWRVELKGSGIDPIKMHPPLWFWSRNGFAYKI